MAKTTDGDGSRVHMRRINLPRSPEPQVSIDGSVMPGEAEPLAHVPGRGPVTKAEVLANMRRRQRIKNSKLPADRQQALPDNLPDIQGDKEAVGLRLPVLLIEYINLIALLENLPMVAVVEAALMDKALRAPRQPEQAKENYFDLQEALMSDSRPQHSPGRGVDLHLLRPRVVELLAAIDEMGGQPRQG
ncbi:hypothetical protein [Catellatospora sp. NPDC049609]|uniref:hypothetical protein n=1 Tax=Catellatospora sp. NPDC049609 TaxID=3155505 RepID=UPI0034415B0D